MAPRNPVGGACLPRTFKCRICGQHKTPAAYSKNQLQKWYNKKRNDRGNTITPENIGLSCKEHLNDEREIRCHGPCDRIKVVGHFSKAQRNNLEPWCINCTEWRLSFDGTEVPDYVPNERPMADDEEDDEKVIPTSIDETSSGEDDDDDDDFDDGVHPYDRPTIVSNAVDRLEGYGDETADEDITTDTLSITHSAGISCWNDNINDGRSEFGSGKSTRTVTGTRSIATQSGRTLAGVAMPSGLGRDASRSQGYTATSSNIASLSVGTAPAEVADLTRLAAGLSMGYQTLNTQASQFTGPGKGSQALSSRYSAASRQMTEAGVGGRPFAPVNNPIKPTNPTGTKQPGENQRPGKGNNKWYKGDNRKVFPGKNQPFATRAQDGKEAAHDSDSPDEM
ncbi:hypothetical protein F4803DRAFT_138516 [Xylaria telfairii]|nr:hypothetical protein F4803DRAFT_138516 [Xylaria telfairii]